MDVSREKRTHAARAAKDPGYTKRMNANLLRVPDAAYLALIERSIDEDRIEDGKSALQRIFDRDGGGKDVY